MSKFQLFPSARLFPQKFLLIATMTSALLGGSASVALAASPAAAKAGPLTHAEVLQDLAAYQKSGLANLERDESQSQVGTAEWYAARDRYLALRHIADPSMDMQALSRQQVRADLKLYQQSGLAAAEQQSGESADESAALAVARDNYAMLSMPGDMAARVPTRAEIEADAQIYRESGLAAFDRIDDRSAIPPAAYAAARARYQALRANGRWRSLVLQIDKNDQQPG